MKKIQIKKMVAISSIIILFLNLLFVGLGYYNHITFWLILAITAVFSLSVMKYYK